VTLVGLDDTDSRELGMCTTYVAARVADALAAAGHDVERTLLVRLNPAVEHKTRGNAALAIHTDADPESVLNVAREQIELAETDDPRTNPGVVVADCDPDAVPDAVADFARDAVREHHEIEEARILADEYGFETLTRGNGRGLIGALAAVGAWRAFDEWTYEHISYREHERWGSERNVDLDSVFDAAEAAYPDAWDTVDRVEGQAVCVPHTPCPILYGIRGDDPDVCREVAESIESESVASSHLFVTNQGTDAHLREGTIDGVEGGRAYRVDGEVVESPETREGGHVFFELGDGEASISCAAFEPTKRFRDRVRALREGDELTVCGEISDGTLKLEKFAVRELVTTERVTPDCPDCGNSMKSAGRNQGYRCRDCGTATDGKVEQAVDRDLKAGWYEVPPCARRHIAKPLIRGGFDGPMHPER
jgi:tRNA(Ile2)-agmatinylcytidine synthase